MRRASIAEAKAKLSSLIAHVKAGEEVVLTERGRPVARLCAVTNSFDEVILDMVKQGLLRLPEAEAQLPAIQAQSSRPVEIEREDRF
ncbi:MAG: type II toxin-antitoxin system prevent-host-death family antitoxin [Candidatus Eremiobacteraeota bacterium]|nr:type II toxin-antitoxin system prevent-host-death family antitoxin [Candidatus Eremiobacteraeota bacterium]MCW5866393.1 type II toxin-antitoxin system prevent-host-death family antitoxin [Candidatus Eremiobacteraeota bacterium]